MGLVTIQQNN